MWILKEKHDTVGWRSKHFFSTQAQECARDASLPAHEGFLQHQGLPSCSFETNVGHHDGLSQLCVAQSRVRDAHRSRHVQSEPGVVKDKSASSSCTEERASNVGGKLRFKAQRPRAGGRRRRTLSPFRSRLAPQRLNSCWKQEGLNLTRTKGRRDT